MKEHPEITDEVDFNPRTREGCDEMFFDDALTASRISIHAPVKGATVQPDITGDRAVSISIHAPVKGATKQPAVPCLRISISIHAPVKGATASISASRASSPNFNPRTREGCDALFPPNEPFFKLISIHAPVKGATSFTSSSRPLPFNFNPRTREGCDRYTKPEMGHIWTISIHAPVKGATPCHG